MRQFQTKIAESVYSILVQRIKDFGLLSEFKILKSTIVHIGTGSSFHFYGIYHHVEEIKGFEGADIGWIEEAEGLTSEQWKVIEPTLRKEGAEAWLLYNPRLVSDFIETFKHDPENGVIVRHINYDENPFLSNTMLRKIMRLKRDDYDEYVHVYEGVPLSDDDRVLIKRSWIEAAIDAHIKLGIDDSGESRLGFDVADSGADLNAWVHAKGIVNKSGDQWKGLEDELLKSCTRVYNKAIEVGAVAVGYDSIGVGALAGGKFEELNDARKSQGIAGKISYYKFIAGAGVVNPDDYYVDTKEVKITNKDFFCNLKSQTWWAVADRFRNTYNAVVNGETFEPGELISIDSTFPDLATLVTELSTPRKDYSKDGKVKVESKEDLEKRDVKSPNYAEAFIIANAPREIKRKGFFDVKWQ
jgi:phage terminase large subunit